MMNEAEQLQDLLHAAMEGNIASAHVRMRTLAEDDFSSFYRLVKNEDTCRMMGWPEMKKPALAGVFFDLYRQTDPPRWFALEHIPSGHFCGCMEISLNSPLARQLPQLRERTCTALAFAILPEYRRRGLMKEFLPVIHEYIFDQSGFDCILGTCFAENTASASVHEACGYTRIADDGREQVYARFR